MTAAPPSDRAAQLEALVRHHNRQYWDNNTPQIDDLAYDALVRELRALWPDAPVLGQMGPSGRPAPALPHATEVERLGTEVVHATPMLSLDKAYADDELTRWTDKVEGDLLVMPKVDGVACSILYGAGGHLTLAATRGDGERGDDITANVRAAGFVPLSLPGGDVEVRGEIHMRRSRFQAAYAGQFANPRNLTAGAIKQKDPAKVVAYGLSFLAYDLRGTPHDRESDKLARLRELGFDVIPFRVVEAPDAPAAYRAMAGERESWDFEADGVVFRANRVSEQARLGATAHHPRHALAYKFKGEASRARLLDISWSVSRSGTITPVAILEPTQLSGVTVSRASLHHAGYLAKLGISKGAEVLVMRRGDVIPHVEAVVVPGTEDYPIPQTCPSCGSPTRLEGDFLTCTQPQGCLSSQVGTLKHFTQALDIQGFGPKVLKALVEQGLCTSPPDLYRLTPEALVPLDRMGDTLARKLVTNIQQKRSLTLVQLLVALGVDELGPTVADLLVRHLGTLERLRAAREEDLHAIHGIGEAMARSVVTGLQEKAPLLDRLLEVVTLVTPDTPTVTGHALSGKSVVFTGTLTRMDRKEAQRRVVALGGKTPTAVTRDLDYLVSGKEKDGAESTKVKAARRLVATGARVKVITEEEFLGLL